jgi:hypothetical protein
LGQQQLNQVHPRNLLAGCRLPSSS